jgi:hypothetical protein
MLHRQDSIVGALIDLPAARSFQTPSIAASRPDRMASAKAW